MANMAEAENEPPKGVLCKIENTPQKNELTSVDGFSACPRCDGLHLWRDRFGLLRCSTCQPPPHRALVAERLMATLEGPEPLARSVPPAGRPTRPVAEACVLRAEETLGEWWARLDARGAGTVYVAPNVRPNSAQFGAGKEQEAKSSRKTTEKPAPKVRRNSAQQDKPTLF